MPLTFVDFKLRHILDKMNYINHQKPNETEITKEKRYKRSGIIIIHNSLKWSHIHCTTRTKNMSTQTDPDDKVPIMKPPKLLSATKTINLRSRIVLKNPLEAANQSHLKGAFQVRKILAKSTSHWTQQKRFIYAPGSMILRQHTLKYLPQAVPRSTLSTETTSNGLSQSECQS